MIAALWRVENIKNPLLTVLETYAQVAGALRRVAFPGLLIGGKFALTWTVSGIVSHPRGASSYSIQPTR